MTEKITPPSALLRMLEGRAGIEAGILLLQLPLLKLQAKKGHGEPIIVLPGFMADDTSTIVMRYFLNSIGYRSYGWGIGSNRGRMLDLLTPLLAQIRELHEETSQKIRLIGWSRGGMLSREIARDFPELIDRVITIGSPVKGGIEVSSIGGWVRRESGMSPVAMSDILRQRQSVSIKVPIKSIYSKLDGVVAWKACIDDVNPDVEHFEIHGSHIGMGTNVEVFKLLPKLLHE
ncbi:MAG: triacylglycerol esterase/lipase EstA (alpha/beta hydrolase family) [Candidatus Azotimanducaceae bacterium]|jgi:triacylglycerol esterase/lipase EstA (alpha/beta hydrolase family)